MTGSRQTKTGTSDGTALKAAAGRPDLSEQEALKEFWRIKTKRLLILIGILAAVVIMFVVAMMVGPIRVSALEIAQTYLGMDVPRSTRTVVMDLRTPPALMAVVVGAALALAGAQMQPILDNPLAEPYTLGVSAAAGCGAAIVIATGLSFPVFSEASVAIGAALFALLASGVIALVSRLRRSGRETIILLGIALVFGFQALLMLLQYRATQESLQRMVFWTMGSLERATWFSICLVVVALVTVIPLFGINQWKLTALSLGEARARAMGVKVDNVRMWTLLGASLIAALSVSSVGIIGFVGLVGPHVARILGGEDQRLFVPTAMACGSLVLCSAHAVAQVVVPGQVLPVGILTALVGVPVFVLIILGRRRTTSAISN
ncbi:MAG: iron ABC transporter permease [Propionibacterium sp.]|nr:iron ABC transporter permease [Propionibacterium sp.]